jgi:peptide chain release factor 1
MYEALATLAEEHAELEKRLAEPDLHADQGLSRRLSKRYAS